MTIIGIDLGTTNSCVAIMDGKEPKVIENVEKNDELGKVFKAAYTSYVMGFFSGVNVVYEDDTGLDQFEGLYQEAISNCKAAPDASFVAAIINLYAEIKK